MKPFYRILLAAAAVGLFAWPQQSTAQEFTTCPDDVAECVVEWSDISGLPIINALRNTIVNDDDGGGVNVRPADRVYVLRRGGLYYDEDRINNAGWDLRLYGQTFAESRPEDNVCGTSGTEDCGPAVIQRYSREDGSTDGVMIQSDGDVTGGQWLTNLWLQGQSNTGVTANYEPIVVNSTNSTFVYDNVVFDRNDWHHLGFKAGGNSITIKNSAFRNLTGPTQRYEGRGIRLEGGAKELIMENNYFINMTMSPVQSEAAPIEYFVFNHNTLVNFGLVFNAGGIWKQAYITNNIMVNPFWQGESADLYDQPDRADPFSGVFGIATLPARFGLETDRRIVLANNAWYRDPAIETFYTTFDPVVRAQPLVNDSTQQWFNIYDGMVNQGNVNADPGLANAPIGGVLYDSLFAFITGVSVDQDGSYAVVDWDPGRDPNPLAVNFPVPEDLTYTNATLLTAGTDGLPLGDLNWYPASKATYETNRETYITAIEDIAGGEPEAPIANPSYTGEGGVLDNATVVSAEGFTSLFMTSGGFIEWTFDLPADAEYGFDIQTNLRGSDPRGENFVLDGLGLRNNASYGELYYCTANVGDCGFPIADANSWVVYQLRNDHLLAGDASENALANVTAGSHTLRMTPSWGYQAFSNIDVIDVASGDTVATLTPAAATTEGMQEECEDGVFCPQGFQYAALAAGGSVSWSVDVPAAGMSVLPQVFYQGGGAAEVLVDAVKKVDVNFPTVDGTSAGNVLADRFNISGGVHTITLKSVDGGLNVDYAIMNVYANAVTGVDEQTLPDGWALDQNYPNPFSSETFVPVTVGETGDVTLEVYDIMGRRVATLLDQRLASGSYTVPFKSRTSTATLASGIYFYRLQTPVGHQVRQMMLIK